MSFYLHEGLATAVNQTKTTPGPVWVIHFYMLIFDSLKVLHLDSYKWQLLIYCNVLSWNLECLQLRICRLVSVFT